MEGVIFDLDGVILSTDDYHYKSWKSMADSENIYFDRKINNRLRGVSRMASLAIILEKTNKIYSEKEKEELTARKNSIYLEMLNDLNEKAIFKGTKKLISFLKKKGYKLAIGSSSKNAKFILEKIGMINSFDAISDGTNINKSKPEPEVFLKAAKYLKLKPETCFVIEDAMSGIEAGNRANMKTIGVGHAMKDPKADYRFADVSKISKNIF